SHDFSVACFPRFRAQLLVPPPWPGPRRVLEWPRHADPLRGEGVPAAALHRAPAAPGAAGTGRGHPRAPPAATGRGLRPAPPRAAAAARPRRLPDLDAARVRRGQGARAARLPRGSAGRPRPRAAREPPARLPAPDAPRHPEAVPMTASAPVFRVRTLLGVPVAMRDGVRLSTDVYLPDAPGPFPVILIRTPYNNNVESVVQDGVYFAQRGYAVAIQDVRGRNDSEGEWSPFLNEARDGYDAQEWCGTQPWSTGKLGTSGGSYGAATEWPAAAPP